MRLYKYLNPSIRTYESIKNSEFYFPRFNQLNDPCELSLIDCNTETIAHIRYNLIRPGNSIWIFCLSETNDNLHMWTQYADWHKGIVVEFETDEDPNFFKDFDKVVYSKNPPKYNQDTQLRDLIFTKSLDSDKEKEWRVFWENKKYKIKPEAIKSIIYGYRFPLWYFTSSNWKELLSEIYGNKEDMIDGFLKLESLFWHNQLHESIKFYQAKIHHNSYQLEMSEKFSKSWIYTTNAQK